MTSTVDDFCETSNSDVLNPMLLFFSLQRGHLNLSSQIPFQHWTAIKLTLFDPLDFSATISSLSDLLALFTLLICGLAQAVYFPQKNFSSLSLCFPPFSDIFPPYLEIRNASSNYLKKNQAKLSHLPSHNLYTPLPCLALKLLTIK